MNTYIISPKSPIKNLTLLAFIGGIFHSLGFAPFNYTWGAIISMMILFYISFEAKTFKSALINNIIFSTTYSLISLHWIAFAPLSIENFKHLSPLALLLIVTVFNVYFLIFISIFWLISKKILNKLVYYNFLIFCLPLIFAGSWTIVEKIRSIGIYGFPWNLLGSVWIDWNFAINLIAKCGIYSMSFLTSFIAVNIFLIIYHYKNRKIYLPLTLQFLFVAILTTGQIYIFSQNINKTKKCQKNLMQITQYAEQPYTGIRIISTNIAQKNKWSVQEAQNNLHKTIQLSFNKPSKEITYFIWPETAFPFLIKFDQNNNLIHNQYLDYTLSFLNDKQFLIMGCVRKDHNQDNLNKQNNFHNSLIVLDNKANIIAIYDKSILVPFGEFMPLANLIKIKHLANFSNIQCGEQEKQLMNCSHNNQNFYGLICFESIFPFNKNQKKQLSEVNAIINVSNDAWFGKSFGPAQHFRMVRIRAIEANKPLIRVTNGGISGLIDKKGQIVKASKIAEESSIDIFLN